MPEGELRAHLKCCERISLIPYRTPTVPTPLVNVIGTIRGATYLPTISSVAFCHWRLVSGSAWRLLGGAAAGATQAAAIDTSRGSGGSLLASFSLDGASPTAKSAAVSWEHPIDAHFSAGDVSGWPQLSVTVWAADENGRADVVGYGSARVPTAPGSHALEIATWRPEGTARQEMRAAFTGTGFAQLSDDTTVTDPVKAPRYPFSAATSAAVLIELDVLVRGFSEQGVTM